MRLPYRILETPRGQIGYYAFGHGPPLIMLHAAGAGAVSLLALAQQLPGRAVTVPDLHGYGETTVAGSNTLDRHNHILDAICTLTGELPDLLGHSMGGALAAMKALRDPAATRRLVLIEPILFAAIDFTVPAHRAAREHDKRVSQVLFDAVAAGDVDRGLAAFFQDWNDVPFDRLRPETQARLRALAPTISAEVKALAVWQVARNAFAKIDLPVLLMAGSRSPATAQAIVRGLEGVLPASRTAIIDNAAHMGPVTQAELFAPQIASFLAADHREKQ